MTLIIDPTVYDPSEHMKLRGAIGRRESKWLRKMVVLRVGYQRHQTVLTDIGEFALTLLGGIHANYVAGLQRATSQDCPV